MASIRPPGANKAETMELEQVTFGNVISSRMRDMTKHTRKSLLRLTSFSVLRSAFESILLKVLQDIYRPQ
jgi:hypothetical protein